MADRTVTEMVDDLDPTGQTIASERIRFVVETTVYEIDLCKENAEGFHEAIEQCNEIMGRYVKAGRLVMVKAKAPAGTRARKRTDSANVRRWNREVKGREIGERGRIPAEFVSDYAAAGSPTTW
jgi:hypothetical protein